MWFCTPKYLECAVKDSRKINKSALVISSATLVLEYYEQHRNQANGDPRLSNGCTCYTCKKVRILLDAKEKTI